MIKILNNRIVLTLYLVIICGLFIFFFTYKDENYENITSTSIDYSTGWFSQSQPISLPYGTSGTFTINNVLPANLTDADSLILTCRFHAATVYVDGTEIYQFIPYSSMGIETDTGNVYLIIPLCQDFSGKTIQVDLQLTDSIYKTDITNIEITSKSDFILRILYKHRFALILSVVLIVSGLVYVGLSLFIMFPKFKSFVLTSCYTLLATGIFSVLTGIWVATDTKLIGLITGNMPVNTLVCYYTFALMPISYYFILYSVSTKRPIILRIIICATVLNPIVQAFLYVLGIADMTQLILPNQIIDVLGIIYTIVVTTEIYKTMDDNDTKRILITGYSVFLTVSMLCIVLYVIDRTLPFQALFLVGLIFYLLSQVIIAIRSVYLNLEQKQDYAKTKEYAYTDELTGLANARAFWDTMEHYQELGVHPNSSLTIITCDLNRLKYYNDNFGHEYGDSLLAATGECLQQAFPSAILISRTGGDEFNVILNMTEAQIKVSLQALKRSIADWNSLNETMELSIALGYASVRSTNLLDLKELAKIADQNMLSDKREFYQETNIEKRQ